MAFSKCVALFAFSPLVDGISFLKKAKEDTEAVRYALTAQYGEEGIGDRLEEVKRFLQDKVTGCENPDSTFNADKLNCDIDSNGWDSKCRCKDDSKTLTAVSACDVNHCGGAYSTSCLGVKDQKTAWINEFLSGSFIPLFNGCCDTHDEGYCVPGGSKLAVDQAFGSCMHSKCDSDPEYQEREECEDKEKCSGWGKRRSCHTERKCQTKNKNKHRWCHLRADIAYTAVERGGLKAFNAKMDSMMECQ